MKKAASNDRGMALIIVLWMTALLSMLAVEFAHSMRVEVHAARNFKNEVRAYYRALGAVNLALAEIGNDYDIVYLDKDGEVVLGRKREGVIEPVEVQRSVSFEDGGMRYAISDEMGKLNINMASRDAITGLLRLCGVEAEVRDTIADSILDWRDANHEFHLNGAEDDYYLALSKPYEAKDGPLDTTEELLLVRGMSPVIFYGPHGVPPWMEAGPDPVHDPAVQGCDGIGRYITVNGNGKLNINTADEKVLEAVFGRGRAYEIMLRRESMGFFEHPVYGGTVTSNVFLVDARGEADGLEVGVRAVVERTPGTQRVRVSYWGGG